MPMKFIIGSCTAYEWRNLRQQLISLLLVQQRFCDNERIDTFGSYLLRIYLRSKT